MVLGIGINDFGRIGTIGFQTAMDRSDIQYRNASWIKYDPRRGTFNREVSAENSSLTVWQTYHISMAKDPVLIALKDAGVEYIMDATGVLNTAKQAKAHIYSGAWKVIICSPSVDVPMFVMDVNEKTYNGRIEVKSGASCTTNALSPLAKTIHDKLTIVEAPMTTTHAYTASQKLIDVFCAKSLYDGRSAPQDIIPSATSAAVAVGRVFQELEGKITGMALIVPIPSVSVDDLT